MKEFTFCLTEQDLQLVVRALAQQPYGAVAPLMAKLEKQHAEQQTQQTPQGGDDAA